MKKVFEPVTKTIEDASEDIKNLWLKHVNRTTKH